MVIKEVKTIVVHCFRTNWVFVKVITDEPGIYGIGEGTLEYKEATLCAAIHDLEHGLIGKDPLNIEGLWHDNYRDAYWRGGPVFMSALSAVDMALWDILGKTLNTPVWQLLGGKCREKVPCYANCWFSGAKEPEEFAEKAAAAIDMGWKGLKWDPFGKAYRQLPPEDFRKAIKCIEKVHEVVNGRAELLIECHGRFDLPTSLRLANALEPFNIMWMEEPIIPDTMEAYADLRRRVKVPISCGERLYGIQAIRSAIELRAADYLQPDPSHAGGITEMKKIAALCEAHHIPFCAHNPSGPVANAVTLALGVSTPGYCIHETLFNDVPWRSEVCDEDVKFVDGYMYANNRPGLGIDINEEAAAKYPFEPHYLRHYEGTLTNVRPPSACNYFHS